jgi:hypothetical protein
MLQKALSRPHTDQTITRQSTNNVNNKLTSAHTHSLANWHPCIFRSRMVIGIRTTICSITYEHLYTTQDSINSRVRSSKHHMVLLRGTYACLYVLSQIGNIGNRSRISLSKQLTGHSLTGTNPHKFNRLLVLLVTSN